MASTYSNLKIQLMATGENSGTWGSVTNVNLGTALEEAIVGSEDVTFASANVTLTLTNSNASQTARNLRLNLTGTTGGARDLIVPAIEKVYIINNGTADTITVKNSTGSGVAVPTGKTMYVYNTGSNVVDVVTHLTSLTLGTPLAVAQGGTGSSLGINVQTSVSGVLPVANGGTGSSSATFSGANITALNSSNISTGTLAVARGGTGAATLTANNVLIGNGTSAVGFVAPGTSGNVLTSNGSVWSSTAPAAPGAPTTNQVLSATAGASVGATGTYAMLQRDIVTAASTTIANPGDNVAGSDLWYAGFTDYVSMTTNQGQPSGTWKAMGFFGNSIGIPNLYILTLFLRIS